MAVQRNTGISDLNPNVGLVHINKTITEADEKLREFAKFLFSIDTDIKDRNSLLFKAMQDENLLYMRIFLENGADANAISPPDSAHYFNRVSALFHAVYANSPEMAKVLIEHGAEVCPTKASKSPLLLAVRNGEYECAKLFLEHGANVNAKLLGGWSSLSIAAGNGNEQMVKLLLDNKADLDALNDSGSTALRLAALNGHLEIVKILVAGGATIDLVGGTQDTPLEAAKKNGHTSVVDYLTSKTPS